MYHRLGRVRRESIVPGQYVTPRSFDRQLRVLTALGYQTISLTTLLDEWPRSGKAVILTFDDGYRNFFEFGLPILRQRGGTATVFLVADQIGGRNAWDIDKGDVEESLMDEAMVRASREQGITFGSHSASHADLCRADSASLQHEIAGSKEKLEAMFGFSFDWFCYPYGIHDERVRRCVKSSGYQGACATGKRANTPASDRFALERINIRGDTSLPYFVWKLIQAVRKAR